MKLSITYSLILLTLLSVGVLLPDIARQDVINVNEACRIIPALEMKDTGDWIVPKIMGEKYLTKPVLIYWILGAVFSITGSGSELISRLPVMIFGILTVLLTFEYGRRYFSYRVGLIGAVALLTSYYFYERFQLAELDGPLVFFVLAGIYCMQRAELDKNKNPNWWYAAFAAWAAAFLLKWIVFAMFFIPFLGVLIYQKRKNGEPITWIKFMIGLILFLILSAPWCILLIEKAGWDKVIEVMNRQTSERLVEASRINSGSPAFYLIQTPAALMPWTILLVGLFSAAFWKSLFKTKEYINEKILLLFCIITFVAFSAVKGKETEYLLPLHPFLLLLGAAAFEFQIKKSEEKSLQGNILKQIKILGTIEGVYIIILAVLAVAFPAVFLIKDPLCGFFRETLIAKIGAVCFPVIGVMMIFAVLKLKRIWRPALILMFSIYLLLFINPARKEYLNSRYSLKPAGEIVVAKKDEDTPMVLYKIKKPHHYYYFYNTTDEKFSDKKELLAYMEKQDKMLLFIPGEYYTKMSDKNFSSFNTNILCVINEKEKFHLLELKRKN